jgi:hypothetical protein
MPYTMTATAMNLAIGEQEHCSSHIIKFKGIDSCIGIVARKGDLLTAAHLVLSRKENKAISVDDVPAVVSVFDAGPYDEMYVVGQVSGWAQSEFFKKLCEDKVWLKKDTIDDYVVEFDGDKKGNVGAYIAEGKIKITDHA